MKKILVITPIYKIIGREELNRDSECVHDLIKTWNLKEDINIKVVCTYIRGLSRLPYFFSHLQLKYYFKGYRYTCDEIPVLLVERQNLIKNQLDGLNCDAQRISNIINTELVNTKFQPNILLVHIPSASKYFIHKIKNKSKKIAVLHYSDVLYLNKKNEKFIQYLNNTFDMIFSRSEAIYKIFKDRGLKNLSTEIIYSGVPKFEIRDTNFSKFNEERSQILYVGKLIKRKNLDILIKALAKIDNQKWKLNVIGKGPMLQKYRKIVKELKLENNIQFLGTFSKNEIFEYMNQADIFCMPSVKETLGMVYLEAMSQGCITIGTKDEGIDGIIKNGENGFLTICDENHISRLLNEIINDKKENKIRISMNAINSSRYFNENDMSERYLNLISKVEDNDL